MKAGILTFYKADSFGAVLQAYALQQAIGRMGVDCEFVDIQMPKRKVTVQQPAAASPAAAIFARRLQAAGEKRSALFEQFRRQYMHISRPYQPTEDIAADYDLFVAGSDQIWNLQIPDADSQYFLPFARPEQRCSYAASFGGDPIPEKAREWVAAELKKFRALSVRESSGVDRIRELTDREASVCLDPTLLLDKQDWESLLDEEPAGEWVTLFLLKYDEDLVAIARAEAERRNLPLRIITAAFMPKLGMEAWVSTDVKQWLSAIRGAECVFTNSFHGLVFSMIFERPFRVKRLGGELASRNGRIEELLDFLQLSDGLEQLVRPDYKVVWDKMSERRAASLAYLKGLVEA